MNLYILHPYLDVFNARKEVEELSGSFEKIYIDTSPTAIKDVEVLYSDNEEKYIVLDPDYIGWDIDMDALKNIQNLKAVCILSTAYGWAKGQELRKIGVNLCNTPNFSTNAVAEWAFMMAMMLVRKVPLMIRNGWEEDFEKYAGFNLKDKKVGIVGLGNIGSRIAQLSNGVGMDVLYWSRNSKNNDYEYTDLDKLIEQSDLIFPALAGNEETQSLITDEMIDKVKATAVWVNIVNAPYKDKLLEMVSSNKLGGFGFEGGRDSFKNYNGNVLSTPHHAWCTKETFQNNTARWIETISGLLDNKSINIVN